MQKKISLRLLPAEAANVTFIKKKIATALDTPETSVSGYHINRSSIDARSGKIRINLSLNAFIDEPFEKRKVQQFEFRDLRGAQNKVVIIGTGPAGLFAALKLAELGIKPVLLERGKDVRSRRRDLAILNREGILDPESNYCFGEGGAGTYSDGKLYTRSNKRGNIDRILNLFVHFGAEENILYESHPHIGTNKLPRIIAAMRQKILDCGGEFFFEKKVTDFIVDRGRIRSVITSDRESFAADAFILATGHSARDIFELLEKKGIALEAKPFALGVRIEHPQALIDSIQYHCPARELLLPPASYSLVHQVNGRGVFSFCMCPGGIIAPASTSPGELVVNGWSPSKRNNPYANSGIVVQVEGKDAFDALKAGTQHPKQPQMEKDPLLFMKFQKLVEASCFAAGGGKFVAPAQRMADFSEGRFSTTLPGCSYQPGLRSTQLSGILPGFIHRSLARAFVEYGKKMPGYFTNEAVVVATESRTSSPVRIPRNLETMAHPALENFYPCGEGAGYAGGIVSAAMDGERVAMQLAKALH